MCLYSDSFMHICMWAVGFFTTSLFSLIDFHFLNFLHFLSSVLLRLKLVGLFMYSEFNKIFVLSMSNSEVVSVEFDVLKRPSRELQDESDNDPVLGQATVRRAVEDAAADEKEEKFNDTTFVLSKEPVQSPELGGEFKATDQQDNNDEDDDGFKTPTSLDHKIPTKTQCPPAPRKSNSFSSRKRRPVSSNVRRTLRLDLSHEVESLFPKPIFEDLHRKIKKARRES